MALNREKHLYYMRAVLMSLYSDPLLRGELLFKGGTAAMMAYGLTRFSTDLDFNIRDSSATDEVYARTLKLLQKFGKIEDAANKHFGPVVVLNYGAGEHNLKVEMSRRRFDDHYRTFVMPSMTLPVMTPEDMFSHKLCALSERRAPRDVFDCHFFLLKGTALNPHIIAQRKGMSPGEILTLCADTDEVRGFIESGATLQADDRKEMRKASLTLEHGELHVKNTRRTP